MKLQKLKIKDFRGLTFKYDFSEDNFIVLTGINGSGKSTIIDAVVMLLSQSVSQVSEQVALQVTADQAELEIEVQAEDNEVHFLAQRIHDSQPNQAPVAQIEAELNANLFLNNRYKRKLIIAKPVLNWRPGGQYVQEYINDNHVELMNPDGNVISGSAFSTISREILLKFEQLDSLNLSFSQRQIGNFSIQNIFQASNENIGQRISRTTVSASPLFDSLIQYSGVDESGLSQLIDEYNRILEPIAISKGNSINGITNLVLDRGDGKKYTVETASSGQKKAIVLATLKYIWNKASFKPIVLLDEPENSMHPGLTSKVFGSLSELAERERQPSFIIATHSPEVVASNVNNTYRILTSRGVSRLTKVTGLNERAAAIAELGVHFHLDYVAQKIVFVESEAGGSRGGLNDADAYQALIDPAKEGYFFISAGNVSQVRTRKSFQDDLLDKLKVATPGITMELTDRDDNAYDPDKNTPFRNIEYLYIANLDLLAEAMNKYLDLEINSSAFEQFIDLDAVREDIDAKDCVSRIKRHYRIRSEIFIEIQKYILKRLRSSPNIQSEAIKTLIGRFS